MPLRPCVIPWTGLRLCILACLLAATPARSAPYENLVFEGGGIRGIAYCGALQALEEQGALQHVQRVAGTSVGAIVAALYAVGYTPAELQHILQQLRPQLFNDGSWSVLGAQYRIRRNFGWYRGDQLERWLRQLIAAKTGNPGVTMQQLRNRAAVDARFKDCYITATDLTAQVPVVFSADRFPDMELVTAVRVSVSIPIYFEAVWLDAQGRRATAKTCPGCHVYVDGGIRLNYPLSLFDSSANGFLTPNHRTLGMKLERPSQADINRNGGGVAPFAIRSFGSFIGALYNITIEGLNPPQYATDQSRTIYISTENIRPRVRKMSGSEKELLFQSGYRAAAFFLKQKG